MAKAVGVWGGRGVLPAEVARYRSLVPLPLLPRQSNSRVFPTSFFSGTRQTPSVLSLIRHMTFMVKKILSNYIEMDFHA